MTAPGRITVTVTIELPASELPKVAALLAGMQEAGAASDYAQGGDLGRTLGAAEGTPPAQGLARPATKPAQNIPENIPGPVPGAWSAEEDQQLRDLWTDDSLTRGDIAERIGRSMPSVIKRISVLCLPRRERRGPPRGGAGAGPRAPVWSEDDDATLRRMWVEDAITEDIAAALSRTHAAVSRRRADLGLPPRRGGRPIGREYRRKEPERRQTSLEDAAAIERHLAEKGATKCPPAYAAPVNGAEEQQGRLPHTDTGHEWSKRGHDKQAAKRKDRPLVPVRSPFLER